MDGDDTPFLDGARAQEPGQRPAHRTEPDRWWLRLGTERAAPAAGCGAPGCDTSELHPTDVYCHTHERPIRTGGPPGRTQQAASYGLRIALCVLFVLAAERDTPVPLFLAGAVVGGVFLSRPIAGYRTTRTVTLAYWIAACLAVLALPEPSQDTRHVAAIAAVAVAALVLLGYAGNVAGHGGWSGLSANGGPEPRPQPPLGPRMVAICAGYATVAVLAAAAWRAVDLFLAVPPLLPGAAWTVAQLAGAATVVALVVSGVAWSAREIDRHVAPLVRRPQPPELYAWWPEPPRQRPPRAAGWADRIAVVINEYGRQVVRVAVAGARSATNFVILFFHVLVMIMTAFVNWAYRRTVLAIRRARGSLVGALRVAGQAGRILATTTARSARVVVFPAVALAGGAWLVKLMADAGHAFLTGGAAAAFAGMLLTGAGAALLLTLAWVGLSGRPLLRAIGSAVRSSAIAAASGLVFVAVAGWLVGLPGTLGYWHIHVGWVTVSATTVAIASYLWSLRRRTGDTTPVFAIRR